MAVLVRRPAAYGSRAADPGLYNPCTAIPWVAAYWADDPKWTKPADGGTITRWPNGAGPLRWELTSTGATWNSVYGVGWMTTAGGNYFLLNSTPNTANVNIPARSWSVVQILHYPAFPTTRNWTDVLNFANVGGNFGYWSLIGGGLGATDPTITPQRYHISMGGTRTLEPTAPAPVVGVPHLMRVEPVDSTKMGLYVDEQLAATETSFNTLDRFELSRSGGNNNLTTLRHAFFGVYRSSVNNVGVSADPAWAGFKNWVRSYYGIRIA